MLITSIQELRLASPAHALDSIDGLVGFIDNSEHDFLEDKLGTPLYNALCQWYDENPAVRSSVSDYQTGYWNRLLLLAQRCVAFDALGRAIGMQAISVNNAGINMSIADDYPKADDKAMQTYRDTCTKEAHAALNQLLRQLEQWCKRPTPDDTSAISPQTSDIEDDTSDISPQTSDVEDDTSDISPQTSDIENSGSSVVSGSPDDTSAISHQPSDIEDDERSEIVTLWKESRYYYLAAALLIPSCEALQSYLNIYDSREKFIQLLPDLRFIQEEIIANSIGEDLLKVVIDFARDGKLHEGDEPIDGIPVTSLTEQMLARLVDRLRKVMVSLLVGRTSVLKYTKEQKVQAHDDGVRMLTTTAEVLKTLIPPAPVPAPEQGCCCRQPSDISHQTSGSAACWTPPIL